MNTPASVSIALGLVLALAGCGDERPRGEPSESALPWIQEKAETQPANPAAAHKTEVQAQAIPDAVQGRWGLVPADCTSERGDAKGLLVVDPYSLQFYESVGKLGPIQARDEDSIRASFAFTGEGQSWEHEVVLELQDGGRALTRREFGPDAAAGSFTYTRCG